MAASAVLHAAALLLLLGIATREGGQTGEESPAYDLVFEGAQTTPATEKPPGLPPLQPADVPVSPDAPLGPPSPDPVAPPQPDAADAPAPPATQSPAPAAAAAPESTAPSTPPPPLPDAQSAPDTAQPTVNLEIPTDPAPAQTSPLEPIMPQLPPPQQPPLPRPAIHPRPSAPPTQAGTLSHPMDLSLAPAAPRPAARGAITSRGFDLSPPPEHAGGARSDPYAAIRAANASADWNRGLLQYWLAHRYYPSVAAEAGEQGTVTIQLTVNRTGRVEAVEIVSRSGSQWLDLAALGTFRGAKLPPFTAEMLEDRITFPIPISYYLVRR